MEKNDTPWGGGHLAAGSAVVKGMELETIVATVEQLIQDASQKEICVQELMSDPRRFMVEPSLTMGQARKIMVEEKLKGVLVCDQGQFLGSLSAQSFAKAEKSARMDASVKGFMKPRVMTVAPGEPYPSYL